MRRQISARSRAAGRADIGACRTTTPGEPGSSLVGGGRGSAKRSSWALAAEMERYVAEDAAPPNVKTVRTVRT
ncbi:MAG: hypothetical protein ABIF82_13150 [Planctomycetota bacterium]